MRRTIPGLLVWFAACGFQGSAAGPSDGTTPADDARVVDAAPVADAALDTPVAQTCWQRWLDHQPVLADPAKITELSSGANDRDPWLSKDGQRLYFAREPGTRGEGDIYLAKRAADRGPFDAPVEQVNLDSSSQESRPALTDDELILTLASDRGGAFQIYVTKRTAKTDSFGPPNQDGLAMVNGPSSNTLHYDPFFTNGGKTIYYAPDPPGPEQQHIWFSTRPTLDGTFGAPAKVPVINGADDTVGDSDPALFLDERVIVFSSNREGGQGVGDLYYATRASAGVNFGAPARMPTVNSNSDDGDPYLSDDGCDLYFASTRAGSFDLYVSHMTVPR